MTTRRDAKKNVVSYKSVDVSDPILTFFMLFRNLAPKTFLRKS